MGTVPIVIFRGLGQSRAQGHGELGPPHFPGYTPAWCNRKLELVFDCINPPGNRNKQTNKQRILVNFSISKNSMALGTRPLERVPNNVS